MNKFIYLAFLFIFSSLTFSSCGDDKDSPAKLSSANAKGEYVWDYGTDYIEKDEITLWINEYNIYAINRNGESAMDLSVEVNRGISYYPLSMDMVYEIISEEYGTEINETSDFSKFSPNPTKLINFIKSNKSKYRYIAYISGSIVIFNRVSNENYY